MFFYRAWIINEEESQRGLQNNPTHWVYQSQFEEFKWGYGVLLGLTMIACLVLNTLFLSSFFINGITGPRYVMNELSLP